MKKPQVSKPLPSNVLNHPVRFNKVANRANSLPVDQTNILLKYLADQTELMGNDLYFYRIYSEQAQSEASKDLLHFIASNTNRPIDFLLAYLEEGNAITLLRRWFDLEIRVTFLGYLHLEQLEKHKAPPRYSADDKATPGQFVFRRFAGYFDSTQ